MKARVLDSVIREAAALAAESAAGSAADADLLRRFARTRDEAAFAELLRRHARLVWAVCRQSLPSEADAEDAFQAVFLALARGASRVHDPAAVAGWLHATAVRVAAFARRSAARRKNREQAAAAAEAQHPVSDQAWADLLAAVHDEVARLPEALRAAFVVCDLEGVPQAEAAARLGWKPGTLTGRLCKARHRLLERLTRRGLAPAGGVIGCGIGAGTTAAVPPGLIERAVGFSANPATIPSNVTELAYRITEGVMTRTKLMITGLMVAGVVGLGTGAVVMSRADAQVPTTGSSDGSTTGTTGFGTTTSTTSADGSTSSTDPGEGAPQGPAGGNAGPSPRSRVEHKLVDLKDDGRDTLENVLRVQGNQGWEFCSVQSVRLPDGVRTTLVAVFKRPVPPAMPKGPVGAGIGGIAGPGMMPPGGKWNISDEVLKTSFNRLDKNSDGKLTEDELTDRATAGWKAFDTNKDGALDLKEYRAYLEARLNDPTRGGGTTSGTTSPPPGGTPPGASPNPNFGNPPTGFNPLNTLGLGGPPAGGVSTPGGGGDTAEDIHLIPVKHGDPTKVMNLVLSLIDTTEGFGRYAVDADARVIIVRGTPAGVAKLKALVEKLDLPPAKKQ